MTFEELQQLIAADENVHLELKKTTGELKDGMHAACAFLNGAGGWLVFGVTPKSLKILGQEVTDSTQQEIAQALSGLEPAVSIDVQYIDIPNSPEHKLIAMYFEAFVWGSTPYTFHGRPYYKVESTTKPMPRYMFEERLRANKPNFYAWERQKADHISIEDMDEKLIRGAMRLGVEKNRMPATALTESLADVLGKLDLLSDGVPNNAAAALFSTKLNGYTQMRLRMARFRGTDKMEFIDNQRVEGNFFQLLDAGMAFFLKHLNMSGRIVGFRREENMEVPAEALREAFTNCLCHRQFEKYNLTPSIAIYDDRIEIENPGVLPPQLTTETIKQSHGSYPYNPIMAEVLYRTTFLESWGSGASRIMTACKTQNVHDPIWSINGGFVCVTFVRPITDPVKTPVGLQLECHKNLAVLQNEPSSGQDKAKNEPSSVQRKAKNAPSSDQDKTKNEPSSDSTGPKFQPERTQVQDKKDPSSNPNRTQVQKGPSSNSKEPKFDPDRTQVPTQKDPSSDSRGPKFQPESSQVEKLISVISRRFCSVTRLMELSGKRNRKKFRENYILPALQENAIERKYPDTPNHPRQQYRLTEQAKAWKKDQTKKVKDQN